MKLYLTGSLRNPRIPQIGNRLRKAGHDVFDDYYAAGRMADTAWRRYEQGRGHNLAQALKGYAAQHVLAFDVRHLSQAQAVILVLPCGRSGHLELGWALGQGKRGYVLLDADPGRYDVMYGLATGVFYHIVDLLNVLSCC